MTSFPPSNISSSKFLNNSKPEDFKYLYKGLARYFLVWYVPLVYGVGTIGGIFCLFFLFYSKLFPRNILIWMVSICVGDLMILQWDALRMLMKLLFYWDIRDSGVAICKLHNFLSNFFFYWSAYMQTCMSLQRLYFVRQPLKARVRFTFKRVFCVWLIATLICTVPHAPYLAFWIINTKSGDCEPYDTWYYYVTTVLDLLFWGIFPLAGMTVATLLISVRIFNFGDSTAGTGGQSAEGNGDNAAMKNRTGGGDVGQRHGGNDNARHVTRLLLSLNFFYMATTYPLLIYLMHLNFGLQNKVGVTIPQPVHKFYYYLLRSVCYLNSSCNWLFYCASGKVFRKRTKTMLRRLLPERFFGPANATSSAYALTTRYMRSEIGTEYRRPTGASVANSQEHLSRDSEPFL